MGSGRVSLGMQRLALLIAALAAIGGALWFLQRPTGTSASAATSEPPPPPVSPLERAEARPFDQVTRLANADERQQLEDQIASAQASRAAVRAAPLPRLPELTAKETAVDSCAALSRNDIRTAMRELIPFIADCYERGLPDLPSPDFDMIAELTLVGDPDIGTLVEVKALSDKGGKALATTLDDCFKTAFQLLALPPLAEGDKVEVRYPFVFRQNG